MVQNLKLFDEILDFCRHIADANQIIAACVCSDYALGLSNEKSLAEVLLIVHGFQPKLMNYLKVFRERSAIVLVVDQGVYEMDVERGFLGEAIASGLLFPYIPLVNGDYLRFQEIKLKKRLILELLENLVLAFPELSYEFHIKPEYFLYETILSRARLFPPMLYNVFNFMRKDVKKKNVENSLKGYLEALKDLESENVIEFSDDYVRISKEFADKAKTRKVRFTSLFKTAQRALFTSLLGFFPKTLSFISQSREALFRLQRFPKENSEIVHQIEDPQKYLYVPTASGLIPLASKVDVETFAKKVLCAGEDAKVEVEEVGGVLNDVYLVRGLVNGVEKKVVVKSFRDWSSFKWFPLTLWTFGTRTFAVLGLSRLERECAINQLLRSKGFRVPKIFHVSHSQRLIFIEYIEGENLSNIIKRILASKTADNVSKELEVVRRVGEEFAKIHALGIALGDTKPENIIVGKNGEIYILDFEQASRNGDMVWDVAEFLYYAGHYVSPFVGVRSAELITKVFIEGYLGVGGDVKIVKEAGKPKYTKVFSVFTLPHIMLTISNACRKADKPKGISHG
ncbi:MAG: AarF/UbiB family protein [Candidatus Bathyarchaeota archaeon]|nr:AarF/UbiB family protein [Candidatus Bathyarchaeota archaeon]